MKIKYNLSPSSLLCSPELIPQIVGGDAPDGEITENESVKHFDAIVISVPASSTPMAPANITPAVTVVVEGPVMENWSKSSRICGKSKLK